MVSLRRIRNSDISVAPHNFGNIPCGVIVLGIVLTSRMLHFWHLITYATVGRILRSKNDSRAMYSVCYHNYEVLQSVRYYVQIHPKIIRFIGQGRAT